jgi:hypothetical protein
MGTLHRQLQQPQMVGEITAAEANEIKALNALLTAVTAEADRARQVVTVTVQYRLSFLKRLLEARQLPPDDLYTISDDTGRISRTHELMTPEVVQSEAEPEDT